eukprot:GHVO01063385.1.p1 GENE.GHVO01063385.1~~GHVO01063385.1.p1  ORF type:complete len:242 (+),score=16.47 GHVO01063385.1:73-798(+)
MTVVGMNFIAAGSPHMNVTQLEITTNTSNGVNTFPQVNYPPKVSERLSRLRLMTTLHDFQPCSTHNETGMSCETPALSLPSKEEFGSFTAKFRFGFLFEGHEEYEELDGNANDTDEANSFSVEIEIVELPSVEEQHWPPYDPAKREVLNLEVSKTIPVVMESHELSLFSCNQITWGAFQNQAVVNIGGVECSIVRRFNNLLQFYPPDKHRLSTSGCNNSPDAHSVNVSIELISPYTCTYVA